MTIFINLRKTGSSFMNVYTARQPILNKKENVVGYELLYRDGEDNRFPVGVDSHEATTNILLRTHLNEGLPSITDRKLAFINFSEACILKKVPTLIPRDQVVVEILEDVSPSDEVYQQCAELFKKGYRIALDDFIYKPEWDRFLRFVKIVKFDISKTPIETLPKIIDRINRLKRVGNLKNKLIYLAERVETREEFEATKKLGFSLFQGYFFYKPEMKKTRDVNLSQWTLFNLYQELCRPEMDLVKISSYFESDEGLTYKLLTFMNSGLFSIKNPISSIKQALIYLGEFELRKFLTLLTTSVLSKGKPDELLRIGVVRARTCELAAAKVRPELKSEAFLVGLLSMLPSILDKPITEIIDKLPINEDIRAALLPVANDKKESDLKIILNAVSLIEGGSWHNTSKECMKLNIKYDFFCDCYKTAISWARQYQSRI